MNLSIFNFDSHTLHLKSSTKHRRYKIFLKFTVHPKPEVLKKGLAMICIMDIDLCKVCAFKLKINKYAYELKIADIL